MTCLARPFTEQSILSRNESSVLNFPRLMQASATLALFAGWALFLAYGSNDAPVGRYARSLTALRTLLVDGMGERGAVISCLGAGLITALLVYFGPARKNQP